MVAIRVLAVVLTTVAAVALGGVGTVQAPSPATETGSWEQGAPLNEPRAEIAAAVLDRRLYVAGGFDPSGTDRTSLEVYDPDAGQWELKAPMPLALDHLGMAALDGLVYVAGGNAGPSGPSSALLAYDPRSDSW